MAQFAIHTLPTFLPVGSPDPLKVHSDSLNNIARQSRTKKKENLKYIACAEGQCFVLHSGERTAFWFECSSSERT